ncbi:uncharacterized protein LOC143178328 [Calliopsis andreniformis]|uniref:uncharacterized protein LOC143178328 n=1 Tax=Calliopsis andreniformis TaxID=337506 RepID=UPI003FCD9FC5
MASIFNLFGDITEPDKGQIVPLSRSKTSLGVNMTPAKAIGQARPKGLSIRTKSDLNIPTSRLNNLSQDGSSKQQESIKLKLTQLDYVGHPVSPSKELAKKDEHHSKLSGLAQKEAITDKKNIKHQRPLEEHVWKKPLPPKVFVKKSYPKPEILAPYYDMQNEFDIMHTKIIAYDETLFGTKKHNEIKDEEKELLLAHEPVEFNLPKIDWENEWKNNGEDCEKDLGRLGTVLHH